MTVPPVMYEPGAVDIAESQLTAFATLAGLETGQFLADYVALHQWSVREFRRFWHVFVTWSALPVEGELEPVCRGDEIEHATFFPGLRLNYAECLLTPSGGTDDQPVVGVCHEDSAPRWVTRGDLRDRVRRVAAGLANLGIGPGDHVAAIARNDDAAIVACLATAALGATWACVGPDLAAAATLNRFRQLEPSVLFSHSGYRFGGRDRTLAHHVQDVAGGLPTLRAVVALDTETAIPGAATTLSELADSPPLSRWTRFPFNQPLFVLFSSGTTGPPKCLVHGAGGTLLEHVKEHRLHGNLSHSDRLLYYTSCGWMMWNWQLSALAAGAAVVAYDGSAAQPVADQLWRLVADAGVTAFGTSPAYLQYCQSAAVAPRAVVANAPLRTILSTGSTLHGAQYDWVAEHVGPLPLQSISGGTDILGCFVLGAPNLPVYRGECSCVGLGLDVRAVQPDGHPTDGPGELVCGTPFPSRPLGLLGDIDGSRFHDAYFSQHDGLWTHGDLIELTRRGSARVLGRTDGVMNIKGIRIGPGEIYAVLEGIQEVAEGMAVEQVWPEAPGGTRLVLLVVLTAGAVLDRDLTLRIKREIKQRSSPNHVPGVIAAVPALPMTLNGKRSERAARDALNDVPVGNIAALRNPDCLDGIRAVIKSGSGTP